MRVAVRRYFGELQDRLCRALEELDGRARFVEDRWTYESPAGGDGGGITRVMAHGAVFEKGGVNLSEVTGALNAKIAARLGVAAQPFYATGVSLVLHPASPMIPTVHLNVRYLELRPDGATPTRAWFGGGTDLTPYYLFEEDATWFHARLKQACDLHDRAHYPRFKRGCDEYFRIPHRGETRGVGGVFFDYLEGDLAAAFAFVREIGDAFLEAYVPIARRRAAEPWGERERNWQLVRRGRYVEFNLVCDRGTLFGLETGGRTESILMSLPPVAHWVYDQRPEPGSREAALVEVLRAPREWVESV